MAHLSAQGLWCGLQSREEARPSGEELPGPSEDGLSPAQRYLLYLSGGVLLIAALHHSFLH